MKKIRIPFDGSDNALRAVKYVATRAHGLPSLEIFLLHVPDPVTFKSQAALLPPAERSRLWPDQAVAVSRPARQILDRAGISGCDGVIMGTRGMGAIANVHDRISSQPRCALGQCASHLGQMIAVHARRNR